MEHQLPTEGNFKFKFQLQVHVKKIREADFETTHVLGTQVVSYPITQAPWKADTTRQMEVENGIRQASTTEDSIQEMAKNDMEVGIY